MQCEAEPHVCRRAFINPDCVEMYVGAAGRVGLGLWISVFVSWRAAPGVTLIRLASVKLSGKAAGLQRKQGSSNRTALGTLVWILSRWLLLHTGTHMFASSSVYLAFTLAKFP